jgi:LAO/AO transport system kinase
VDPTSPFSGGALLGDRVRMKDLAGDPGIFIRSMATRGSLGGLARATSDVILVMDAAGYERIIVETVGVGQAEVDIASEAHTTIVVESPGMGDEIQAIKAGVLEIADILVVNKADREGADHTVMALKMMLGLGGGVVTHHGRRMSVEGVEKQRETWVPPIVKTIAIRGEGTDELLEAIDAHARYLRESGRLREREYARARSDLEKALRALLLANVLSEVPDEALEAAVEEIAGRRKDPYAASRDLLKEHVVSCT